MPQFTSSRDGHSGEWPPLCKGYWVAQQNKSLQQIEVLIRGIQPPIVHIPSKAYSMAGRLEPLLQVASVAAWKLGKYYSNLNFSIQLHDEGPWQHRCLRFDAPTGSTDILLPDPYALGSSGFRNFREKLKNQPLPPWNKRLPLAFWRGASTGMHAITTKRIENNQRYQLCKLGLKQPSIIDAKLTSIVQSRDNESEAQLRKKLTKEGIMGSYRNPYEFGMHKYIIEIDGNVNSWGLLWKLLSGSCILRVNSQRRQWYHHRLKPFENFIPIRSDLSDLIQKLNWCSENQKTCEQIAIAGQELAHEEASRIGKRVIETIDSLDPRM